MPRRKKDQLLDPTNDFPVDIPKFMAATQLWTDAEVGFYFRLLAYNWTEKELPNDPERLVNLPGGSRRTVLEIPKYAIEEAKNTCTRGYTQSEHSGTSGYNEGTEMVQILASDRLIMWEFIKGKFRKGAGGGLVNNRVELVRKEKNQYFDSQRVKSKKAVEAKRLKRLEREAQNLAKKDPKNTTKKDGTRGYTPDVPRVRGGVPYIFFNSLLNNTVLGREKSKNDAKTLLSGLRFNAIADSVPAGTTPVQPEVPKEEQKTERWYDLLPETYQKYYRMTFDDLQKLGSSVAAGVTVQAFKLWRQYVRFCAENGYEDLFEAKFLRPKDFAKVLAEGFIPSRWKVVTERMLASGIQPSYRLDLRIPEVMLKWLKMAPPTAQEMGIPQEATAQRWDELNQQALDAMKAKLSKGTLSQAKYDFYVANRKPGFSVQEIMSGYQEPKT